MKIQTISSCLFLSTRTCSIMFTSVKSHLSCPVNKSRNSPRWLFCCKNPIHLQCYFIKYQSQAHHGTCTFQFKDISELLNNFLNKYIHCQCILTGGPSFGLFSSIFCLCFNMSSFTVERGENYTNK